MHYKKLTEEKLIWTLMYADDISLYVAPLRRSGKLYPSWMPHFLFLGLTVSTKCWLLAERLQLKLQIQSSHCTGGGVSVQVLAQRFFRWLQFRP